MHKLPIHRHYIPWIIAPVLLGVIFSIKSPALAIQPSVNVNEGSPLGTVNPSTNPTTGSPLSTVLPQATASPTDIQTYPSASSATTSTIPTSALETSTEDEFFYFFLPFIREAENTPTPTVTPSTPETYLFCDSLSSPLSIPDNNPTGISNLISIDDPRQVLHFCVYVDISHTWVSDLTVSISNLSAGETQFIIDRPGYPATTYGCSYSDIITILDDRAEQPVEDQCYSYPAAISGAYRPNEHLKAFIGTSIAGPWRIRVVDSFINDTGSLNGWCLEATIAEDMPSPTPTPPPEELPSSASVPGMSGEDQQLPLDCESRSAVDWAAHFGVHIDELDFYYNLPHSDDPDLGFVGDVMGLWGQIPPYDYGVHAIPIATLLTDYGLPAYPNRALDWDDVRAEIAAGDPVITWIIGGYNHSLVNGIPRFYTAASNGHYSVVAAYEHTVIVTGYTATQVTVLNGGTFVTLSLDQFLDSWSALWNMAILANP